MIESDPFLTLEEVETPVAVLDLARVRANARRVVDYCVDHGIAWRPHVKTHKSLHVARIQLEAGAQGLTVATPREAEVMAAICDDLLLAYPALGPAKLSRLMALPESVSLTVGLDSREALEELGRHSHRAGRLTGVLVEVDMGMGRVGVQGPREAVALARRAAELPGTRYRGVMFYPGHLRSPADEQLDGLARMDERIARLLEALEDEGLTPEIVSGGSTPTLWNSHRLRGITEIRPGTCIFNDRDILAMEACKAEDLGYSVLATVVSTAVPGKAVLDAGSKALAKESFRSLGGGFGFLLDRPEVEVVSLSEEHGVLSLENTAWTPRVGERVRVIPNHVCVSVNLQDRYVVDTGAGLEVWPIEGRGRGPWRGPS